MSGGPSYPAEIQQFLDLLGSLPGVYALEANLYSLTGITVADLSLPHVTKLPLGMLRHTEGGEDNDGMVQFEFRLEPTAKGWKTLEFLAWFVRDAARGKTAIQMRPFAMPPYVGGQVQLGHTLRFHIDLFFHDLDSGSAPVMKVVQETCNVLKIAKDLYGNYLNE